MFLRSIVFDVEVLKSRCFLRLCLKFLAFTERSHFDRLSIFWRNMLVGLLCGCFFPLKSKNQGDDGVGAVLGSSYVVVKKREYLTILPWLATARLCRKGTLGRPRLGVGWGCVAKLLMGTEIEISSFRRSSVGVGPGKLVLRILAKNNQPINPLSTWRQISWLAGKSLLP